MSNIFNKRIAYKPFEYPFVQEYIDRINQTFWVHNEVDFSADMQDFNTKLTPAEKEVILRSALAIAQVEVTVKEFWGKLYDFLPKPEFNDLGATFSECYIEGTEVLTETGWKDFRDLQPKEKVATFDKDRNIFFVEPSKYIAKPYKGEMYDLRNGIQRFVITPGHKLTLYKDGKEYHEEVQNVDFNDKDITYPLKARPFIKSLTLSDLDILRAVLFSYSKKINEDDDFTTYEIELVNEEVIIYLQNILKSFYDNDDFEILEDTDNGITKYQIKVANRYGDLKKCDWFIENENINDKTWCYNLLYHITYIRRKEEETLYNNQSVNDTYVSCEKRNVDYVQKLACIAGVIANVMKFKEFYILIISYDKEVDNITNLNYSKIQYDGKVYCVSIPETGNLITRYDDSITFSGNCEVRHSQAYSRILDVLDLNERFEKLLEEPIFKKKYKFINSHFHPTMDFLHKLFFFTIVIENSSLFSQFANFVGLSHHRGIMKNMANMVSWSAVDEACFPEYVEIKTKDGWKKCKDVKTGDIVYAYDKETKEIKEEKVFHTIHKTNVTNEDLICLHILGDKGTEETLCLTKNHDVLIVDSHSEKKTNIKLKASELKFDNYQKYELPMTSYNSDGEVFHYVASSIYMDNISDVYCVSVPSGNIVIRCDEFSKTPIVVGNCHAEAGEAIINQIFLENPEKRFTQEYVETMVKDYIQYEEELLEWIFEPTEFKEYKKKDVINFMKHRIDESLVKMGYEKIYNISTEEYKPMLWFDEYIYATDMDDFFAKRVTAYTKHDKPITGKDLF